MSQPGRSEVVLPTGNESQPGEQNSAAADDQAGQFGGFKTAEELAAAYTALKAQQTQPPVQPKADEGQPQGAPKTIEDGAEGDDGVAYALKAAGLSQDDFTQEFAANGKLSEESYEKLGKAGFPKQMVDIYVRGLQAEQEAYSAAVYSPAGGAEGYNELLKWAGKNLTAAEKTAFNEAVTSGDPARASLAVQGVVAKKGGTGRPTMLHGKASANADQGVQPYTSLAQVTAAKNDPRYRRDPAYRAEVTARLRASAFLS